MPACTLRAGGGRRLRVWGHQVLAVRLNKKKCQHSVPGGCAGSSPLPSALCSEHPASDSQQHPLASAPELSSPSPLPKLCGTARANPGLSAVTHPHSPKAQMVTGCTVVVQPPSAGASSGDCSDLRPDWCISQHIQTPAVPKTRSARSLAEFTSPAHGWLQPAASFYAFSQC